MVADSSSQPDRVGSSRAWWLVGSSACLLAFAYACWDIQDFDVWWHLNAGKWIVENGSIPRE